MTSKNRKVRSQNVDRRSSDQPKGFVEDHFVSIGENGFVAHSDHVHPRLTWRRQLRPAYLTLVRSGAQGKKSQNHAPNKVSFVQILGGTL